MIGRATRRVVVGGRNLGAEDLAVEEVGEDPMEEEGVA